MNSITIFNGSSERWMGGYCLYICCEGMPQRQFGIYFLQWEYTEQGREKKGCKREEITTTTTPPRPPPLPQTTRRKLFTWSDRGQFFEHLVPLTWARGTLACETLVFVQKKAITKTQKFKKATAVNYADVNLSTQTSRNLRVFC